MFKSILLLATVSLFVVAAPVPAGQGGSGYTGNAGQAEGGNFQKSSYGGLVNLDVLNIGSGNAGKGGSANSGNALGGGVAGGCAAGNGGGEGGDAYTGLGGQAHGGDYAESSYGGLVNLKALNIASNNAGKGGEANSGSSVGGGVGC